MSAAINRSFTINAFSLIDVAAAVIVGVLLVVSVVRYFRITRMRTDLLFSLVLAFGCAVSILIALMDNVVPAGIKSLDVVNAPGQTLLLGRVSYAFGILLLAATLHFALEYTGRAILNGWQGLWLYASALSLAAVCWWDGFTFLRSEPLAPTSRWDVCVPWMPIPGPFASGYLALWALTMGYVHYLLWGNVQNARVRRSVASRTLTVRIGLAAFALSGVCILVESIRMWAGISSSVPVTVLGMILVAIGLAREWEHTEQERAHVRQRFESYVDPTLVEYVLEHPDKVRLDGEVREMTVAFTDLEGYTPLCESMRERVIPLLNEYLSAMTPLIKQNNGYRSKFLGDGIMFFYGAPEWSCDHAMQAVSTVLMMQETMIQFNAQLFQRGLRPFVTRIGVSSGEMIVGDAGSVEACDYTVMGNAVNLGSRLESANKATGTHILISETTRRLLPDDIFLLRPIGRLLVVGLSESVMTYEPLGYASTATEAQRKLVELTTRMVGAFQKSAFADCLTAELHLTEAFGPSKLAALYHNLCQQYLKDPPDECFTGDIRLAEK